VYPLLISAGGGQHCLWRLAAHARRAEIAETVTLVRRIARDLSTPVLYLMSATS
jgi:hypothetical protein